jgi:DNA-binding NarL/FixJ family response regulator
LFSDALAHAISQVPGFHGMACSGEASAPTTDAPDAVVVQGDRRRDQSRELVGRVKERWPGVPVVAILRTAPAPPDEDAAIDHWISDGADVTELQHVLERATALGPRRLEPSATPTRARPVPRPARAHGLTQREVQVLRLLAMGTPVPDISERFAISHHTVRKHAQNAMYKLGAHSRLELVAVARQLGLLEGMRADDRGRATATTQS